MGKVRRCAGGNECHRASEGEAGNAQPRPIRLRGEALVGEHLIERLMQLPRPIPQRLRQPLAPVVEGRDDDKALSCQRGDQIAERQGASATTVAV